LARPFCFVLEREFSFSRSHNTQAVWVCKKNLQKSFHWGDGERQLHWPTTSLPQSKADYFLICRRVMPPAARLPRPATKPATSRANRAQWPATAHLQCWPGNMRPHSSRTGFDRRTVPAQPHKPAQVFLPIIAQRCKIMLALRGKRLYLRG
jgi:hypothetical protein